MTLRRPALLALAACLLPVSAFADSMDQLSFIGNGLDYEFALPASTTTPDSNSYGFGPVAGTLNGSPALIGFSITLPGVCAVCGTMQIGSGSQYQFLYLPPLYEITVNPGTTETLTFLPGTYTAYPEYPIGDFSYSIEITPEATTPEPSSLYLAGTAALLSLGALRRRPER